MSSGVGRIEANGGHIDGGFFVLAPETRARLIRCYGPGGARPRCAAARLAVQSGVDARASSNG